MFLPFSYVLICEPWHTLAAGLQTLIRVTAVSRYCEQELLFGEK